PMEESFVRVPVRMPSDPRLRKTPLAVAVYCEIFRYDRKRKAPYIGRSALARQVSCSTDTIDRAVSALISSGWIIIEERPGKTHRWYRGDGRAGAATPRVAAGGDSRTDAVTRAAPTRPSMAAPVRPEVDEERVDEEEEGIDRERVLSHSLLR